MREPYIGEIRLFGGSFAPSGWLLCDGRELPVSGEYEPLYQLIGTRFGGGPGTFAVPDMRDTLAGSGIPQAVTYIIAYAGRLPAHDQQVAAQSP